MNNTIMTPNNLIEELRNRFKITILELRNGLPEYETKMYCDALGITEQTLSWAIKNWKSKKELKKQEQSTSKVYPTKEKNRGMKTTPAKKL